MKWISSEGLEESCSFMVVCFVFLNNVHFLGWRKERQTSVQVSWATAQNKVVTSRGKDAYFCLECQLNPSECSSRGIIGYKFVRYYEEGLWSEHTETFQVRWIRFRISSFSPESVGVVEHEVRRILVWVTEIYRQVSPENRLELKCH